MDHWNSLPDKVVEASSVDSFKSSINKHWRDYRLKFVPDFYGIARNDRWFAHLHIQNGGSKRIWILTYSWTGNFLLAWAGQFTGIKNQTMHRFEQYLKILQLYHENSRFPPSFKFWSVSAIQKHWEEVKKCILHGFQDLKQKRFSYNPHSSCRDKFGQFR